MLTFIAIVLILAGFAIVFTILLTLYYLYSNKIFDYMSKKIDKFYNFMKSKFSKQDSIV